jgi:hypothetical protein
MVSKITRDKIPKEYLNEYGWPKKEYYRFEGYSQKHEASLWSLIPQTTTFEHLGE